MKTMEEEEQRRKKKMPTVWFALKRSLHCKSEPSEVYDPKRKAAGAATAGILTRKIGRSGCSRSIANLKDVVIHGSKRHLERPPSCSPRSIGSSEFVNPIAHEVILSSSTCELRITGFGGGGAATTTASSTAASHNYFPSLRAAPCATTPPRKTTTAALSDAVFGGAAARASQKAAAGGSLGCSAMVSCHRCGEKFGRWDAMEAHHLSKHAVTELAEGDSSRKIVEIICRTSWAKAAAAEGGTGAGGGAGGMIERVLKVHNMQKTLARFEEHREMVKQRASKLPKKHPRCLADGNELLRFHGATVACSLGAGGAAGVCSAEGCSVCRIIRQGFSARGGTIGVFTTSTSGRALEAIAAAGDGGGAAAAAGGGRKALVLCRVIAGRVHRPVEDLREPPPLAGFDSLAGKVGLHANIEELYLLNPRALLPCFVVICRPSPS